MHIRQQQATCVKGSIVAIGNATGLVEPLQVAAGMTATSAYKPLQVEEKLTGYPQKVPLTFRQISSITRFDADN